MNPLDPPPTSIASIVDARRMLDELRGTRGPARPSSGDEKLDKLRDRAKLLSTIIDCLQADDELKSMFIEALVPLSQKEQFSVSKSVWHQISVAFTTLSFLGNLVSLILLAQSLWPGFVTWIQWVLRQFGIGR